MFSRAKVTKASCGARTVVTGWLLVSLVGVDSRAWTVTMDKALDEANVKGWTVVDMKHDWKGVFPFEETKILGGMSQ